MMIPEEAQLLPLQLSHTQFLSSGQRYASTIHLVLVRLNQQSVESSLMEQPPSL